ncbi:multicopper polyphenol oxidase [Georgenia subflava]|uniref:Multicopper polyphenol oxidase n=1 Tax=Georgenia subflava TaxID=1622177 RepID=A0A6N7EH50_9MICO|nr:polyphenol oxidase family protein [Georgenia subflava]MPV37692.1 multicopper polyphenol oxidase [Georgenia subflava]
MADGTARLPLLPAELGPGARGAFTTRAGGVSAGPYAASGPTGGLDLALHVGDDPGAVADNRERLAAVVGGPVAWMDQVHGATVRVVERVTGASEGECDGLVAVRGGAEVRSGAEPPAVAVLVADCVPVLLADTGGTVVAAAHVGRQGLVRGVLGATVDAMRTRGAGALHAAIGPSICGRCYEVPAALRDEVEAQVPGTASSTSWGTPGLDLVAGVRHQLDAAGVRHVDHVAACTLEDERFYSYRRAGRDGTGATGRFVGVVRSVAAGGPPVRA